MPGGPHPPLELALSWEKNYVDPVTRGGTEIVVQEAVLLTLCVITVALRVYTRKFLAKNFGLDDVLIILSLFPLEGFSAILILGMRKTDQRRNQRLTFFSSFHQIWLG